MVYLVGWALAYLATLIYFVSSRTRSRFLFAFPLSYFLVLFVIRNSGTDTHDIYELALRSILLNQPYEYVLGWEPGFVLMSKALLLFTHSEVWAVRAISVVFIFILVVFLLRASYLELKVLWFYFIPAFIYQLGMNTLRVGIAEAIFLLAWQASRRNNKWQFVLLSGATVLFHYSMMFIVGLFWMLEFFVLPLISQRRENKLPRALVFLALAFLAAIVFWYRQEYLLAKIDLYSDYQSPAPYSGLAKTSGVALMFLFLLPSRGLPPNLKLVALTLVVLTFAFQFFAFYTYAALRFLDLLAFAAPLLLLRLFDSTKILPPPVFWLGILVTGFLLGGLLYRNFLTDYDGQLTGFSTPFLPFRTIFDDNL